MEGGGDGAADTYYERMPWRRQTNDRTFAQMCLKSAYIESCGNGRCMWRGVKTSIPSRFLLFVFYGRCHVVGWLVVRRDNPSCFVYYGRSTSAHAKLFMETGAKSRAFFRRAANLVHRFAE